MSRFKIIEDKNDTPVAINDLPMQQEKNFFRFLEKNNYTSIQDSKINITYTNESFISLSASGKGIILLLSFFLPLVLFFLI